MSTFALLTEKIPDLTEAKTSTIVSSSGSSTTPDGSHSISRQNVGFGMARYARKNWGWDILGLVSQNGKNMPN
jgi:hypothetical protein